MELLYRDFTVCKNCGATCYLNNDYCEDCANELFEAECGINEQLIEENKILAKALELACETMKTRNEVLVDETYKVIFPSEYVKHFKQQAEKELKNE